MPKKVKRQGGKIDSGQGRIGGGNEDIITRRAPAMLIFHARREAETHTEDLFIELA